MASSTLTSSDGVQLYLKSGPFAADLVEKLSGGSTNFAFRLHLSTPFEGRKTLILKHGIDLSFRDSNNNVITLDVNRQSFEVAAMRWVSSWLPSSAVVKTPKIHLFDETRHCFVMDDSGDNVSTLKQFILDGHCTPALARQIGDALGVFIAQVHQHAFEDPKLYELFQTNTQAKRISGWATHGRVVSTLSGKNSLPALEDPPLEIREEDLLLLDALAEEIQRDIMSATAHFVMGDFWPGNVLVDIDNNGLLKGMTVVDWELAKTGLPGHDIGQFAAEMYLIRHFFPHLAQSSIGIFDSLSEAYAKVSGRDSLTSDPAFFRDMMVHQGAHLVAWTPRVPWGTKEATREVVMEGFRQLMTFCKD